MGMWDAGPVFLIMRRKAFTRTASVEKGVSSEKEKNCVLICILRGPKSSSTVRIAQKINTRKISKKYSKNNVEKQTKTTYSDISEIKQKQMIKEIHKYKTEVHL